MHVRVPDPGTPVWIRQRRWTIERARADRHVLRLDVAHGASRLTFLAPFDRPLFTDRPTRPIRVRRQRARARLAQVLAASHGLDLPIAARDARLDLWPFQLEAALALQAGVRRVLLADEVGLGKTIQAALAIAETVRRRPAARVLVVTPAALVDQWLDELRRRFGLAPAVADQDAFDDLARTRGSDRHVWTAGGVIIGSIDFVKQRHVLDAMPLAAWDLVVIDEAHAMTGDSRRHDACHEIAARARHVLLLTATPHGGDPARFDRLCRLGALPSRADTFRALRRTRRDVGLSEARAVRWQRVAAPPACAWLYDALRVFERVVLQASRGRRETAALLLLSVLRKRAASTIDALDRSLERRLEWLDMPERAFTFDWLQPRLAFEEAEEGDDERTALVGDIGLAASQERTWLRRLRILAAAAMPADPKLDRLCQLLARTSEPAIVFTEFRASLDAVDRRLRLTRTRALLHGGLPPGEQRLAIRRFLEGDASLLIATDVGGQGLNLQTRARWVINLDLPWNPARLAQRAGRVDRIGQTRRAHVTHLVSDADSHVIAALARRTCVARAALGGESLAAAAPPADLALAAAVVRGAPLPAPDVSGPAIDVCRDWQRRARVLVRGLEARRRWARAWQAPARAGARPARGTACLRVPAAHARSALAVFTVPIVNGLGDTLERRAVALSFDATQAPPVRALEDAAVRAIATRLRRVRRLAARASDARLAIESAVGRHLHALRQPEEAQLLLASLREARAFDDAQLAAARAAASLRALLDAMRDDSRVDVGRPVLELLVLPPR